MSRKRKKPPGAKRKVDAAQRYPAWSNPVYMGVEELLDEIEMAMSGPDVVGVGLSVQLWADGFPVEKEPAFIVPGVEGRVVFVYYNRSEQNLSVFPIDASGADWMRDFLANPDWDVLAPWKSRGGPNPHLS